MTLNYTLPLQYPSLSLTLTAVNLRSFRIGNHSITKATENMAQISPHWDLCPIKWMHVCWEGRRWKIRLLRQQPLSCSGNIRTLPHPAHFFTANKGTSNLFERAFFTNRGGKSNDTKKLKNKKQWEWIAFSITIQCNCYLKYRAGANTPFYQNAKRPFATKRLI